MIVGLLVITSSAAVILYWMSGHATHEITMTVLGIDGAVIQVTDDKPTMVDDFTKKTPATTLCAYHTNNIGTVLVFEDSQAPGETDDLLIGIEVSLTTTDPDIQAMLDGITVSATGVGAMCYFADQAGEAGFCTSPAALAEFAIPTDGIYATLAYSDIALITYPDGVIPGDPTSLPHLWNSDQAIEGGPEGTGGEYNSNSLYISFDFTDLSNNGGEGIQFGDFPVDIEIVISLAYDVV